MRDDFSHVETWVFDLDNTLYPPEMRLFDQIEDRMRDFMVRALEVSPEEADRLRHLYWTEHGTTLAGLMARHAMAPEAFLEEVHDISFDAVTPDDALTEGIAALPGRRIVYTNGTAPYARNVLAARGIVHLFDAVYGVTEAGFRPKPDRAAFETVFGLDGFATERAAMFEDDPRNLAVPHAMGLRTVHVAPEPDPADHIHHHTADLAGFLAQLA
ncbi:HAD family hydrolase [Roseivivax halodurans JCM 10272]|uniref:HAD family hydrolase n=1 Tax=Roseivivax halodurans JCM 10272 TaxID=1449350 RepID=X7EB44_9RHOB|nr:pyrimidine 5'-nucleotidase [Roseivivax halodurans]ETX13090.1 HAD family hydrolase [Roseivivax halodurans JCM 10272]